MPRARATETQRSRDPDTTATSPTDLLTGNLGANTQTEREVVAGREERDRGGTAGRGHRVSLEGEDVIWNWTVVFA